MRASSGARGNSTADSDFDPGLRWGGVVAVRHGLTPIAEHTIRSTTSTNWNGPVSPFSPADCNPAGAVDGAADGEVDGAVIGALLAA